MGDLWAQLKYPTSRNGTITVRSAYGGVCGFMNLNRSLPFREISGPSITKNHPKE